MFCNSELCVVRFRCLKVCGVSMFLLLGRSELYFLLLWVKVNWFEIE